jgi:hypothetical protein
LIVVNLILNVEIYKALNYTDQCHLAWPTLVCFKVEILNFNYLQNKCHFEE